jgi:hypothetical protein
MRHYHQQRNMKKSLVLNINTFRNFLLCVCLVSWTGADTPLFAQQYADCVRAKSICDKKPLIFERVSGEGSDDEEANLINCFMNGDNQGQAEENCAWIKFEIAQGGSFSFAITPLNESDDIDFVVFRLGASGDCNSKQIVRCMAAGAQPSEFGDSPCLGKTGLRDGEGDSSEDAGCSDAGDNTWLAPLKTAAGEKYVLLVSNVTQSGPGFKISFGGSAKLPCEEEKPPVVVAETPKPKEVPKPPPPKPQPPKPVYTTPKYIAPPASINGRSVHVKESKTVNSRRLKIKIWDSQVEDGDVISIYLNNRKILDRHYLRLKPHQFEIELPEGNDDTYLTIEANEFGKAEINTATIEIDDGKSKQTVNLMSDYLKNESVRIILR